MTDTGGLDLVCCSNEFVALTLQYDNLLALYGH
jgi:hypothetical protein